MDLYSKKIIGYEFDKVMDTDLAIRTIKNAYECKILGKQVIFNNDLGSQYITLNFQNIYQKLNAFTHLVPSEIL